MKRFINNTKLAGGSFPTTLKKALLPAIALGILLLAGGATSAQAGEYSISKTVDSTTTTSLMRFDRLVESDLTEDICSRISPVKKLVKNARESVRSDLSSQCSGMPRGCAVACSQLPNPDNVPMKARYQLLSDSAEVFVGRVRGYPKQCGKRPVLYPRVEVDAFGEGVCGCTCTYTISVDAYDSSAVAGKSELTPEVRGGVIVGNPADTFTGKSQDEHGNVQAQDEHGDVQAQGSSNSVEEEIEKIKAGDCADYASYTVCSDYNTVTQKVLFKTCQDKVSACMEEARKK